MTNKNMNKDHTITGSLDRYDAVSPDYSNISSEYDVDTLTLGNIDWTTINSNINNTMITGANTLTWTDPTYSSGYGFGPSDPSVNITHAGVSIKEEADLKIGDRSLKDFMDRVEDQLAILRLAPELEERWDQLRDLRRQYEECKQDILEKEKIMKILKED